MSSRSLSHRVCTIVCAAVIALIMVLQFSPMVGGITLAALVLGVKCAPFVKSVALRVGRLLAAAQKRAQDWSGYGNGLEAFIVNCFVPMFSLFAWYAYLSFKEWAIKDVTVAALAVFLSVALPACLMRRPDTSDFEDGADEVLQARRRNFDRLILQVIASGGILVICLVVVILSGLS